MDDVVAITSNDSDYGSDFDLEEANIVKPPIADTEADNPIRSFFDAVDDAVHADEAHVSWAGVGRRCVIEASILPPSKIAEPRLEDDCESPRAAEDESSEKLGDRALGTTIDIKDRSLGTNDAEDEPDQRSPVERFRTKPRKPFSVTDLISPAWCELQYWYTLTKVGKKARTPAMKQGNVIHKKLEAEVHVTVPVKIKTKEDRFGLRIWNMIQGLRTLRSTGLTRELEVWGELHGYLVNGVIDELSYQCSSEGYVRLEEQDDPARFSEPAPDQRLITDFLSPSNAAEVDVDAMANTLHADTLLYQSRKRKTGKIYLADVKTRRARSFPSGAAFRPTEMQLMIYHRLIRQLITGQFRPKIIFERFDLDPDRPFTDAFIAQLGGLQGHESNNDLETVPLSAEEPQASTSDDLSTLLVHNSLEKLWNLLMREYESTFSAGTKSLSNILSVEYREPDEGYILGTTAFMNDDNVLDKYLRQGMQWWRGEREAQGVEIEEAYKCGSCDFAEDCTWRKARVEEILLKKRSVKIF